MTFGHGGEFRGLAALTYMARPLRPEVANGMYHVTARGNGRFAIFNDDEDRISFLDVLARVVERFRWECLAYCLMDNHYHLLIATPVANLSAGMRQLNGVYAQGFNRRHKRCGHLFQGRFGAVLIGQDQHLLEVVRYIALNPVRAGHCQSPDQWQWSSHISILEGGAPRFLADEKLLTLFGASTSQAQASYLAFIEAVDPAATLPDDERVVVGTDDFLAAHIPAESSLEIPQIQRRRPRPSLAQILDKSKLDDTIASAYLED